jgi:hypothetical protein
MLLSETKATVAEDPCFPIVSSAFSAKVVQTLVSIFLLRWRLTTSIMS